MKEIFPHSPAWLNWLTITFCLIAAAVTIVLVTRADLAFVEALVPALGFGFGGAMLLGMLHGLYARASNAPTRASTDIVE